MAPSKGAGNATVTLNSNALTAYCDMTSVEIAGEVIDITNLSSTAVEKLAGLADWKIPIGGLFDSTLSGYLTADAAAGTKRTLAVVIAGVTFTWTSQAFISNFKIETKPNDAHRFTATIEGSGAPVVS